MAKLQDKGARGDTIARTAYRVGRLKARLARIGVCLKRAVDAGNDKLIAAFEDEKELREAELNFLSKKFKAATANQ
jgi:hypothetical protein